MPDCVIPREGKWKSWGSYAKDQRPDPQRGELAWRPETFAWYFLLNLARFSLIETRYGRGFEVKGKERRAMESMVWSNPADRAPIRLFTATKHLLSPFAILFGPQ